MAEHAHAPPVEPFRVRPGDIACPSCGVPLAVDPPVRPLQYSWLANRKESLFADILD